MNYNRSDRDNSNYHTHRSDQYRHPERPSNMRFDDYGSSARGDYGNRGNERDEYRSRGDSSSSRNYGNMGSYGGAQGFGSARGGYPSQRHQDSNYNSDFDSGMGRHSGGDYSQRSHGYESDFDSHGGNSKVRDVNYRNNDDLYGSSYSSRRFRGSDQDHYDFDRDTSRRSGNYGGKEGNYMGSGYSRTSRPDEYGAMDGNYGSSGSFENNDRYTPSNHRNRGYQGGYGPSDYGNNRDRDIRDFDRY